MTSGGKSTRQADGFLPVTGGAYQRELFLGIDVEAKNFLDDLVNSGVDSGRNIAGLNTDVSDNSKPLVAEGGGCACHAMGEISGDGGVTENICMSSPGAGCLNQ